MIWVLVVVLCVAGPGVPTCASGLTPVPYRSFAACEDAAVLSHDQMRARAAENGLGLLLFDTRCLRIPVGDPT